MAEYIQTQILYRISVSPIIKKQDMAVCRSRSILFIKLFLNPLAKVINKTWYCSVLFQRQNIFFLYVLYL